jgi:iron complex outermembrane receptor protein
MHRLLVLLLFVNSILIADNTVDALLKSYAKESDLSYQTKDDFNGQLIVYTRDDLQRMQVHSLSDILKTLPFFTYGLSNTGLTDITYEHGSVTRQTFFKIYFNDHEITSPFYGQGLSFVSKMDLGMVDHIEIYQHSASAGFDVDGAIVVIKLYAKKVERELGGSLSAHHANDSTKVHNIYFANKTENFSYITYGTFLDYQNENITHQMQELKHDQRAKSLYAIVQKDQHTFDWHFLSGNAQRHMGLSLDATPLRSESDLRYTRFGYIGTFFDTIDAKISYTKAQHNTYDNDDKPTIYDNAIPYKKTVIDLAEEQFVITLSQTYNDARNKLAYSASHRVRLFDYIADFDGDTQSLRYVFPYHREAVSSFDLYDRYRLNSHITLLAEMKLSWYDNDVAIYQDETHNYRVGGMFQKGYWHYEAFLSHTERNTVPYYYLPFSTTLEVNAQPLTPEVIRSWSNELRYTINDETYKMVINSARLEDMLTKSGTRYVNSAFIEKHHNLLLAYEKVFDHHNNISLQWFRTEKELQTKRTVGYGGLIRWMNAYNHMSFFHELVWRNGFYDQPSGVDMSFVYRYSVNDDFILSIKGENIFNDAQNIIQSRNDPYTHSTTTLEPFSPITKRFWLGIEYTF